MLTRKRIVTLAIVGLISAAGPAFADNCVPPKTPGDRWSDLSKVLECIERKANVGVAQPLQRQCQGPRECKCDSDEWAVGGGTDGPGNNGLVMRSSRLTNSGEGWLVECSRLPNGSNEVCPNAFVLCVKKAPKPSS